MKLLKNQSGISMIATLLSLMVMAGIGGVIAYTVATGQQSRANHFQSVQSFYVDQAAMEYVMKKIYEGQDGTVPNPITFGPGTFTSSKSGNRLTVVSTVGNAIRSFSLDRPSQTNCVQINTGNVSAPINTRITGITFQKTCLETATITQMLFAWVPNGGERLITIRLENNNVYLNPAGVTSGTTEDTLDFAINDAGVKSINYVDFLNGKGVSIHNKTFTMKFYMADGTTKMANFFVP